jgi:hypothetical protein
MDCSLRDAKNSSATLVPYCWVMESPKKLKTKENNIYKDMGAIHGSNKELLEKIPIYRATKNLIALQILQPVCIIWIYLRF